MDPSRSATAHGRRAGARRWPGARWLGAWVALAALAFAAGCDGEPELPRAPDQGALLGRSASELDGTDGSADGDTGDGDQGTPDHPETVGLPGGSSPLDPRAEPDPIPWTPRAAHGNDA